MGSSGERKVKRCSEDSKLLVEGVDMLVALFYGPFIGSVGQFDGVSV